jgi:hypothetical protein
MTRAERAAEKLRKEQAKLDAQDRQAKAERAERLRAVAQAKATAREEARIANNKRRYYVGALADDAGLFAWSNSEIAAVFAVLARLRNAPAPAALLDGLLEADMHDFSPGVGCLTEAPLSRPTPQETFLHGNGSEHSEPPS